MPLPIEATIKCAWLAIIAGSFWFKLRLEERWMREQFGAAYLDYLQRVKALIPWIP